MTSPQKITPFLWMDGTAEQAATLYARLFPAGRTLAISRYGSEGFDQHHQPEGRAMVVELELAGVRLNLLNGGPMFRPTPAISFFVQLETVAEVAVLWAGLLDGGLVLMPLQAYPWSEQYGWLNDRFGVSWQISVGPISETGRAICPSLLFTGPQHGKAEAAIALYMSLFPGGSLMGILRHDGSGGEVAGTVQHAQFTLGNETFMAMDSALPHGFSFTEGVSLMVSCAMQADIDRLWSALTAGGGAPSMCGWLKDRFGLSWQIVPEALPRLMSGPDRAASGRVMQALMAMRKIDIAALEAAHRTPT